MPNEGQLTNLQGGLARDILFYSIQSAPQMFFAKNQMYFVLGARDTSITTPDTLYRVGMRFIGNTANQNSVPVAREELPDFWNFVLGHCGDGIFGVHASRRIIYPSVYPGIDFHAYSNPWGPKFYLVMHPGSTPQNVKMEFEGQDSLALDLLGQLKAYKRGKAITLPKGLCYQQINGSTQLVNAAVNYSIGPGQAYASFQYGTYNPAYPLVIDISASLGAMGGGTDAEPEWCTFYGHTERDESTDGVVLGDGGLLVCGNTYGPNFPLFEEQDGIFEGGREAYYSEFDNGYKRIYTTLFGGNGYDGVTSIALTSDQNSVYLFGRSTSTNLPVFEYGSGFYDDTDEGASGDNCYISRFSRTPATLGQREWVTHFGDGIWTCNCLRVDADDNVHILGTTDPQNDPGYEQSCNGTEHFFPLCNPSGTADFFQGQVGGGADAFYARFDADLNLRHSTFFGGSATEHGTDLVVDNGSGRVYFTGNTASLRIGTPNCQATNGAGFPLCNLPGSYFQNNLNGTNTAGLNDAYIACLGPDGGLLWSTFVGSTADEVCYTIGLSLTGDVYISGFTNATGYSTTNCAPPAGSGFPSCASGNQVHYPHSGSNIEYYIAKFAGGTQALDWTTFIPGSVQSFMPDEGNNITLALSTGVGANGSAPIPIMPRLNTYLQPQHGDAMSSGGDAAVMMFTPSDELFYSSYFGGLGSEYGVAALPWAGGRLYLVGYSFATANVPFHCPPTPDPYCYMTYTTQSATTGEALYVQLQYDVTIGIEETEVITSDVLIYPNPSAGSISIQLPERWFRSGAPLVDLYDATGRLLGAQLVGERATGGSLAYDLRSFGYGLRFLRLRSLDGSLAETRSIVVR